MPTIAERMRRLGPSLGRRSRVEQQLPVLTVLVDGCVAVAEHNHVGIGESPLQSPGPAGGWSAVVDHPHADSRDVQQQRLGQQADEGEVVVSEHRMHRAVGS